MQDTRTAQGTRRRSAAVVLAIATTALLGCLAAPIASAGPPGPTRQAFTIGEIVPIPAAIPHEEGDMVDKRIVPDLRWIAQHFAIYVTDGYSGPLPNGEHVGCNNCHVHDSDHYNGLAVDLVPLNGTAAHATPAGRASPASPNGPSRSRTSRRRPSAGSATTATPATAAATTSTSPGSTRRRRSSSSPNGSKSSRPAARPGASPAKHRAKTPPASPPGPSGGISTIHSGGVSPRGD